MARQGLPRDKKRAYALARSFIRALRRAGRISGAEEALALEKLKYGE